MTRHTTASLLLLCISATLLLLFSTTASAALPCNATNFMCYEDGNELVADADACNCCPIGTTTNCTVAKTKCRDTFYSCPTNTYLNASGDSCQCCDVSDVCQAALSTCPTVNDERCIACVDGVCVNCISGYWTANGSPCSKCLVANCVNCEATDGRKCATCQDKYKLSDGKSCIPHSGDGVVGLQSSCIAAAAATLAMCVALLS